MALNGTNNCPKPFLQDTLFTGGGCKSMALEPRFLLERNWC